MTVARDVVSGLGLLLLSLLYFGATRGLPEGQGEPGPAFFPMLLAGALALLAVALLGAALAARRKTSAQTPRDDRSAWRKPAVAVGLTAIYVASFQTLGFVVSTWLYTLLVTLLLRGVRAPSAIVIPVVSTLLIFLLFSVALGVPLPAGIFG